MAGVCSPTNHLHASRGRTTPLAAPVNTIPRDAGPAQLATSAQMARTATPVVPVHILEPVRLSALSVQTGHSPTVRGISQFLPVSQPYRRADYEVRYRLRDRCARSPCEQLHRCYCSDRLWQGFIFDGCHRHLHNLPCWFQMHLL
jgi:hypothetical protein